MAKKAAKQAEGEEGAPPAKRGGKKTILIAGVAVLALAGGGGWFFLGGGGTGHSAEKIEEKKPIAFLDVQDMVVNLASDANQERPRFLKLRVALEMKDGKALPEVQPLLPRVVDIFQVFVRELRPSDLEGSGGIYRLREELLRRVNIAVYPTKVDAVLFKEVVVQ